ncbi:MAG: hypothetical protein GX605_04840, partial [Chloroflexi bacterium]|nr:hypothetical protein [Chloroflexota bacterium]
RRLRRWARPAVRDDGARLAVDPTAAHAYCLEWQGEGVRFFVDGTLFWQTPVSPRGPLAWVVWIDNQYAAFPADGRLRFGLLAHPRPAWLEVEELSVEAMG